MDSEKALVAFEEHSIRRLFDEKEETWFFLSLTWCLH